MSVDIVAADEAFSQPRGSLAMFVTFNLGHTMTQTNHINNDRRVGYFTTNYNTLIMLVVFVADIINVYKIVSAQNRLLQLIPTFMWGRCTMTYASM